MLATTSSAGLRAHVLRLLPGTDLAHALRNFVDENKIRAALVLTCVGSTATTVLRMAGATEPRLFDGKFEIVSLTGTLSTGGSHLHMSVAGEDGVVYGGHLQDGCVVRTTAEIGIGVLDGISFSRAPCALSGYLELKIESQPEPHKRSNDEQAGGSGGSSSTRKRLKEHSTSDMPKRGLSPYMLFCNEKRDMVKRDMPPGAGLSDVGKELGRRWRALSATEKETWSERARSDRSRYEDEMEEWRQKNPGE